MEKVIFSAPGSVILSGEYGMSFGKPVLISAIGLRIKVIVSETKKSVENPVHSEAIKIVKSHLQAKNISFGDKSCEISIQSDIPCSENFGYSGALHTALIGSLLSFYSQKNFEREIINELAYKLEKKFAKKSYGIRTSVSSFGGLVYFRKEFEFLRNISLLQVKMPRAFEKHLFLLKEKTESQSREQIENRIGKRYNTDTAETEYLLFELEKFTKRIVVSLYKEDINLFKNSLLRQERLEKKLCPETHTSKVIFRDESLNPHYTHFKQAVSGVMPV